MDSLISIIVPVYNQEKYLSRCLDSILNQTYKNLEIVCIDDKSTDASAEIIKRYADKDSRVVYYRNTGKGVSSARNYGIEKAKGDYIGFVDSDDFIQPQMYEFMLRAIVENDCEMVACGYESTDRAEFKSFEYFARPCETNEFVDLYGTQKIIGKTMILDSACTKLILASFLRKTTAFEDYVMGEDTLFCSNLWTASKKNMLVDLPLYGYFNNSEGTVNRNSDKNKLDLLDVRLKAYKIYRKYDKQTAAPFLFRNIARMESYVRNRQMKDKKNYKVANRLFFKCLFPFVFMREISLKEKLMYVLSYFKNYIEVRIRG